MERDEILNRLKAYQEGISEGAASGTPGELAEIFRAVKYENPVYSLAVLFLLMKVHENRDEVLFHIMNHFLMMGLIEEALPAVDAMKSERVFFEDIVKDYPLKCARRAAETITACIAEGSRMDESELKPYFPSSSNYIKYFELASFLRDAGINEMASVFFRKAYTSAPDSEGRRMLLTYVHFLDKQGMQEEAVQLLEAGLRKSSEEDSVALLYKLASMTEEKEPERALRHFITINKINPEYLDVQNRINKLTKLLNRFNINNYSDKHATDDDDKIHFS